MIGNYSDAALAAERPEEFYLGEGNSRAAFLINGVVYKVASHSFYNESEITNGELLREYGLPAGCDIPDMTLFDNGVLAMEYINGTLMGDCIDAILGMPCATPESCISDHLSMLLTGINFWDQSYGNMIKANDGTIYLIDVA